MLLRRSQHPGTTGLILRRTYPELYKSHIVKMFEEFPETQRWWRQESKELRLPNGSRQFFGSAEHASDMSAYYSAEFDDVMVDEAQEFSQSELEGLSGSNRSIKSGIVATTLYTFMPGISETGLPPIGLEYLKRVLVNGDLRGPEAKHRWAFVQAFAWDNVEWARKSLEEKGLTEEDFYSWDAGTRREWFIEHTDFGATLSAITSVPLRQAWLEGLWTAFSGQYFDTWTYDRHTVEDFGLQPWARYWLSGDWGDYHPACIYLHGIDSRGIAVTIDELWGRHFDEVELGRKIGEMCRGKTIEAFPFSWDAFGRLSKKTRKPITELIAQGLPDGIPRPFPADASPGSRISGWRWMKHLVDTDRWLITRNCTKLIECLPTLMRDMQKNSEDVRKVDWSENQLGDDPADASRYGLQYMQNEIPETPAPKPPAATGEYEAFKLREKIEGMDKRQDPNVAVTISSLPKRRRDYLAR